MKKSWVEEFVERAQAGKTPPDVAALCKPENLEVLCKTWGSKDRREFVITAALYEVTMRWPRNDRATWLASMMAHYFDAYDRRNLAPRSTA